MDYKLGLGSPKKVSTVASQLQVKGLLPTQKMELEEEDIYSEPPLEGGPKTSELSEDPIDSKRLINVLNINPELLASKRKELQDVITKNYQAFGLDDRLRHLEIAVP